MKIHFNAEFRNHFPLIQISDYYKSGGFLFRMFLKTGEFGSLAPIAAVMLPEALAFVFSRSI